MCKQEHKNKRIASKNNNSNNSNKNFRRKVDIANSIAKAMHNNVKRYDRHYFDTSSTATRTIITSTFMIDIMKLYFTTRHQSRVQELCESRGGRPGLFVLTTLMVSVDVKQY